MNVQYPGPVSSLGYKEFEFKNGEVVYMRVASGGGYGDPLERDPRMVLQDIADGIVSAKASPKSKELYCTTMEKR